MARRIYAVLLCLALILTGTETAFAAELTNDSIMIDYVDENDTGDARLTESIPEDQSISGESDTVIIGDSEDSLSADDEDESYIIHENVTGKNESLMPEGDGEHKHCVCGSSSCSGSGHNKNQVWQPWNDSTRLPKTSDVTGENKCFYLTTDVKLETNASLPDGICLCLNGHTIDTNTKHIDCYNSQGTITICNCEETGGIVQSTVEEIYSAYHSTYCMISAPKELYLYNVKMTSENYFQALIKYADDYNLSSVYIDGCTLTNTNYHYPDSGIRVINMYQSAGDITILNSELNASSTYNTDGYTSNYVRAIDLKKGSGKVTIENSEITASSASTMSAYGIYAGEDYNEVVRNGFTMKNTAVRVTGKGTCYGCVIRDKYNNADDEDKTSITIENNCSITVKQTGSSNAYGLWVGGGNCFFKDLTVNVTTSGEDEASKTKEAVGIVNPDVFGIGQADISLDNTKINVVNNNTKTDFTVCGISQYWGDLTVSNGSEITAVNENKGKGYGIYGKSKSLRTIKDSTISAKTYGIISMVSSSGSDTAVWDICDSTIRATDDYGIFCGEYNSGTDKIYLSGDCDLTGGMGGVYLVGQSKPYLYATSADGETALSPGEGHEVTVYYNGSYNAGTKVIDGGMTQALVGKLNIIYPTGWTMDKDGKLVEPTMYKITLTREHPTYQYPGSVVAEANNRTSSYGELNVPAGALVKLTADPNNYYSFDCWEVTAGGVELSSTTEKTATFTMPANDVGITGHFKDLAYYTVTCAPGDFAKETGGESYKVYEGGYTFIDYCGWEYKYTREGYWQTGWSKNADGSTLNPG